MKNADLNRKDDLPIYLKRSDGRVEHVYDISVDIFVKGTLAVLSDIHVELTHDYSSWIQRDTGHEQ
jgi:hypothetical protein